MLYTELFTQIKTALSGAGRPVTLWNGKLLEQETIALRFPKPLDVHAYPKRHQQAPLIMELHTIGRLHTHTGQPYENTLQSLEQTALHVFDAMQRANMQGNNWNLRSIVRTTYHLNTEQPGFGIVEQTFQGQLYLQPPSHTTTHSKPTVQIT